MLLAEVAYAAGLVAVASGTDGNPRWMPTDEVDPVGTQLSTAERWLVLAQAWRDSPAGCRGSSAPATRPGKLWAALSPELSGAHQAETRRMTLAALRALPPGQVLAAGTGPPSLVDRLVWIRPRRPARPPPRPPGSGTSRRPRWSGSSPGRTRPHGRALLGEDDPHPPPTPQPHWSRSAPRPPVDHMLLQADLTAVVPGPLQQQELGRHLWPPLADIESPARRHRLPLHRADRVRRSRQWLARPPRSTPSWPPPPCAPRCRSR